MKRITITVDVLDGNPENQLKYILDKILAERTSEYTMSMKNRSLDLGDVRAIFKTQNI